MAAQRNASEQTSENPKSNASEIKVFISQRDSKCDECLKYSGRVGRTAGAKSYEEEMVTLAVIAHVRHRETNYDSLLAKGWFRGEARAQVRNQVEAVLEKWRG